jgi:hypothetical protein
MDLLAMILMAGAAICATVTLRARTQFRLSEAQYQRMSSDIEKLAPHKHCIAG